MADQAYTDLARALAPAGIRCQFQAPGQMVVSGQVGPIWPDAGNSFWVTNAGGGWFLFTWAPYGYRVPNDVDMRELCIACMRAANSAMGKVPAEIVQVFSLTELREDEEQCVYRAMDDA